jgi:hypothetical protein
VINRIKHSKRKFFKKVSFGIKYFFEGEKREINSRKNDKYALEYDSNKGVFLSKFMPKKSIFLKEA